MARPVQDGIIKEQLNEFSPLIFPINISIPLNEGGSKGSGSKEGGSKEGGSKGSGSKEGGSKGFHERL
jgi:hypothetical protein